MHHKPYSARECICTPLSNIKKREVFKIKTYPVYGFTYEETKQIEQELKIRVMVDSNVYIDPIEGNTMVKVDSFNKFGLPNCEYDYDELERKFLIYIKEKYKIELPEKPMMFASDGNQYFPFYWGIIEQRENIN